METLETIDTYIFTRDILRKRLLVGSSRLVYPQTTVASQCEQKPPLSIETSIEHSAHLFTAAVPAPPTHAEDCVDALGDIFRGNDLVLTT